MASQKMSAHPQLQQQQQPYPPPVPKKPSIRERQRNQHTEPQADGNGYGSGGGLHQNPQMLKNSTLRDDPASQQKQQQFTSPWLDKQLHQDHPPQHQHVAQNHPGDRPGGYDNDDFRRYQIESEMDDLKAENRAKTRELDTNRYIENEMNRKLRIADDAYMLRHLVKDKERQIANQEKIISDLTEDNAKMVEDMADKERAIFQLQSEVDNLDRIILAKNALKETERLEAVSEELDKTKDELASIELEVDGAKSEMKNLQNQLARKDREVRAKSEQAENLSKELVEAKSALANVENEKAVSDNHLRAAERENKALKEQVDKLMDFRERCRNLEEENAYMGEAVRALEAKVFHLDTVRRDKEALEELVHDLKSALKDKNKILKDRRDLLIETQQLKDNLREKSTDEAGLHKELGKLKDVLIELEKENDFYRDLESDFHKIKKRFEELERDKFKNELLLAKLRPKMERLQKRCKEKDDLIRRLANELRGGGERLPRELLLEADQNQRKTLDDYVDPLDYANTEEPLSEQIARSQNQRRTGPPPVSPIVQAQQQTQLQQQQPYKKLPYEQPPAAATPKTAYEPRSAPIYTQAPPQQQHLPESSNYPTYPRNSHQRDSWVQPEEPVRLHPQQQPQRPQQYLPEDSYDPYSAAVAPAEEPVRQSRVGRDQSLPRPSRVAPADEFDSPPTAYRQQPPPRVLDPPVNLRISRVLGDGSVMLEWKAPQLDNLDRNNGVVVAGYKVFVNGVEEQSVVSCRLTKSLIPKASLGVLTSFGVQTFGYDGEISDKIEIPAGKAAPQQQSRPDARGRSPLRVDVQQPPSQQQQQHQLPYQHQRSPSPQPYQQPQQPYQHQRSPSPQPYQSQQQHNQHQLPAGTRRRANRDYRPSNESPSAFPSYELELRHGDDVQTFGPVRPDGMYNAEINGLRGLVPAQYLELTN